MSIRIHKIDPELVEKSVNEKIARYEHHREHRKKYYETTLAVYNRIVSEGKRSASPPQDISYIDPMYDEWNDIERNYYSKVRVIETRKRPLEALRFRLVYGKDPNYEGCGTGPFDSLEKAINWFTKNGR